MSYGDWLTPNSSIFSNPLDCRKISVPGDLWLYVQGALEELTKEHNWEQFGTATPYETSQFWMNVLDEFSESQCGGSGGMIVSEDEYNILFSQAGSGAATISILQSNLPPIMQGCKGLLTTIRYSTNQNAILTISTSGNKGTGFESLIDEPGNQYMQVKIPMDEIGGKLLIDAIGGIGAWSLLGYLQACWF